MTSHRYTLPLDHPDDADLAAARLWAAGASGVWVQPDAVVAWFAAPSGDGGAVEVPAGGRWEVEPDRDWQAEWKASIRPVRAGRVCVVPSWLAAEHAADPDEVTIVLDPGRAFGTGHHATTALCLDALQRVGPLAGARVLDVGTGTGILAIAAAELGARTVVGVDLDPDAIEVAAANVSAAGVDVRLEVGSAHDVDGEFDVVLANLVTDTLVELAATLVARVRDGGTLIVSGVAAERAGPVEAALAAAGLVDVWADGRDGWSVLVGTRQPGGAGRGRGARLTAGAVAGLVLLTGCAESIPAAAPSPPPPTAVDTEASPQPTTAPTVERDSPLDDQVDELVTSVQTSRDLLQAAWDAPALEEGRTAARQALAALTADEGLTGGIAAPGVAPLFPGPVTSREATVDYGDAFTRTLTAAREAGPAGGTVTDLLRDPVAGDVGAWQRDAEGQLGAIRETADAARGAAIVDAETAVNDLEGEGTRALAWALLAAEAGDVDRIRAFGERAVAHLDLILSAFEARAGVSAAGTAEEPDR